MNSSTGTNLTHFKIVAFGGELSGNPGSLKGFYRSSEAAIKHVRRLGLRWSTARVVGAESLKAIRDADISGHGPVIHHL